LLSNTKSCIYKISQIFEERRQSAFTCEECIFGATIAPSRCQAIVLWFYENKSREQYDESNVMIRQ